VELITYRDPMLRIREDILPVQHMYFNSVHRDSFALRYHGSKQNVRRILLTYQHKKG